MGLRSRAPPEPRAQRPSGREIGCERRDAAANAKPWEVRRKPGPATGCSTGGPRQGSARAPDTAPPVPAAAAPPPALPVHTCPPGVAPRCTTSASQGRAPGADTPAARQTRPCLGHRAQRANGLDQQLHDSAPSPPGRPPLASLLPPPPPTSGLGSHAAPQAQLHQRLTPKERKHNLLSQDAGPGPVQSHFIPNALHAFTSCAALNRCPQTQPLVPHVCNRNDGEDRAEEFNEGHWAS